MCPPSYTEIHAQLCHTVCFVWQITRASECPQCSIPTGSGIDRWVRLPASRNIEPRHSLQSKFYCLDTKLFG